MNSRLDTIQAVVLKVKLNAFINHELIDIYRVYKLYNEMLKDIAEVPVIPEGFKLCSIHYQIKFYSTC